MGRAEDLEAVRVALSAPQYKGHVLPAFERLVADLRPEQKPLPIDSRCPHCSHEFAWRTGKPVRMTGSTGPYVECPGCGKTIYRNALGVRLHDADCPMTNDPYAPGDRCVCHGLVAGGREPILDTPQGRPRTAEENWKARTEGEGLDGEMDAIKGLLGG